MAPRWGQDGGKIKKNGNATKKRVGCHTAPPFCTKKWPTWPQVGLKHRAKIDKKSIQKSTQKLMHLGIDFWKDFGGLKWSQVGTKIEPKNDVAAKAKKPTKR